MLHRIFIAINLPESIKDNLSSQQLKWAEIPCRWTKKENLHITLAFLGALNDEELVEACKMVKEVALRHSAFIIKLEQIIYGPPDKAPRMLWVEGKSIEEFKKLQKDLQNSLIIEKAKESRKYAPHITLGRIKSWEFNKVEPEERPKVNENISLSFEAKSIDIMESELRKEGPEYSIIEICPLGI